MLIQSDQPTFQLKTDFYIILYKYGMQNWNTQRELVISKNVNKENGIILWICRDHRSNIFRCNDFRQSNLILQALIHKIVLKTDFRNYWKLNTIIFRCIIFIIITIIVIIIMTFSGSNLIINLIIIVIIFFIFIVFSGRNFTTSRFTVYRENYLI